SEGSIALVSPNDINFGSNVGYGAKNLFLGVSSLNVGTDATLADASAQHILPSGLSFTQNIFDKLIAGNKGIGVPKLESLTIAARESVNFFGSVDLSTIDPATGQSVLKQFTLKTPAIYGYGGNSAVATLTTDTLIWSGVIDTASTPNTPGT